MLFQKEKGKFPTLGGGKCKKMKFIALKEY